MGLDYWEARVGKWLLLELAVATLSYSMCGTGFRQPRV